MSCGWGAKTARERDFVGVIVVDNELRSRDPSKQILRVSCESYNGRAKSKRLLRGRKTRERPRGGGEVPD